MHCGHSYYLQKLNTKGFFEPVVDNTNYIIPSEFQTTIVELYTSYIGKVSIGVTRVSEDEVLLEQYKTIDNKKIMLKVLDGEEHNLSVEQKYTLPRLKSLSAHRISFERNRYYYALSLMVMKKLAQVNKNEKRVLELATEIEQFSDIVKKTKVEYPELHEINATKSLEHYKKIYQKVSVYNGAVDILFNTHHYLDYLYESTGMVSVKWIRLTYWYL